MSAERPARGTSAVAGQPLSIDVPPVGVSIDAYRRHSRPPVPSLRIEPAAASASVTGTTVNAAAAVTLKAAVTNVLAGTGLGGSAPAGPIPVRPAASLFESLVVAGRELLGRANSVRLIGRGVTLDGWITGQVLSPDGTRAVVTTDATNWTGSSFVSKTAVIDTDTGRQVGSTVTLDGLPTGSPLVSVDGTRAVITARPEGVGARVVVLDTATGKQVGDTFTLAGQVGAPTFLSADGTRAVVTTTSSDLSGGGTRLAVIDTASGRQVGTTIVSPVDSGVQSGGGAYALVLTAEGDEIGGLKTRVTVIDTGTGSLTGTPVTLNGRMINSDPVLSTGSGPSGTHVLISTADNDSSGKTITRLAVIDTATTTQIGELTLAGYAAWTPLALNADRSRVVFTTTDSWSKTTQVAVVDTATGEQVGATITYSGESHNVVSSPQGRHVLVTMSNQVAVIDTAVGTDTTVTLPGEVALEPLVSSNGNHVLVVDNGGGAVVVNLITGAHVDLPFTLKGRADAFDIVHAGTGEAGRAVIATTLLGPSGLTGSAQVTSVDTATGAQIGSFSVAGNTRQVVSSADGTHALVSTLEAKPIIPDRLEAYIGRVAVVDVTTGKQVGSAATFFGPVVLNGTGTQFLALTNPGRNTQLAVIDAATGKKGWRTVTVAGEYGASVLVNANSTRFVFPTYRRGAVGSSTFRVAALG